MQRLNYSIIILCPTCSNVDFIDQTFFSITGIVMMMSCSMMMFCFILGIIIKQTDNCSKNFVMMVMRYNCMSQSNYIGEQYKEYRYCFSHLLLESDFFSLFAKIIHFANTLL